MEEGEITSDQIQCRFEFNCAVCAVMLLLSYQLCAAVMSHFCANVTSVMSRMVGVGCACAMGCILRCQSVEGGPRSGLEALQQLAGRMRKAHTHTHIYRSVVLSQGDSIAYFSRPR